MLHGGPGWVSTVRKSAAGLPGAPAANPQPGTVPIRPPGAGDQPELTSVHVSFEHGLSGTLANREAEFAGRVRATYSTPHQFTDRIEAHAGGSLAHPGPTGALSTLHPWTCPDVSTP